MKQQCKKVQEFEIRVKDNGELLLKGSIPYLCESEILFSRYKKGLMKEKIAPRAFGEVIKRTGEEPMLLLNHQYHKREKVKQFRWNDTETSFQFEYLIEPSTELIQNIHQIGAMSFGFIEGDSRYLDNRKDKTKPYDWERTIMSFRNLREISILLHQQKAAYPSALIYVGDSDILLCSNEKEELVNYMKEAIQKLRRKEVEELKKAVESLREAG